ncbi:MAG: ATP-binding cassette domain-containing protein [Ruminococcus flavefaciens]|nr:ATP-binding cassette domain-containing protein [Ruminococcus flavefaciens]MCM1230322.1 ATP-binding cassette domain-containing protein [Ruminococcus flavefaciens]
MREVVLKTERLCKSYRNFTALDNVDMTVYRGDVYGLIGRNGAGKTTMMKIITGLTEKSGGEFEIFSKRGSSAEKEKRRIGCLIENPAFFGGLTAYQNLKYYALQKGITDMKQIDEALALVSLTEVKNKKFRKFSLGMKQRLGIAFAMLDNPDLIILDEPINGLDPIGISELRETFRKLNTERGITFIISSHILSELYVTANRFLIIDHGKVLREITKEELDLECMRCVAVKTSDTKGAVTVMEKSGITDYKVIDSTEVRIYQDNVNPEELNKMLITNNIGVSSVYETGITLEDYFKSLVGEEK